jgi:hypothetical protein
MDEKDGIDEPDKENISPEPRRSKRASGQRPSDPVTPISTKRQKRPESIQEKKNRLDEEIAGLVSERPRALTKEQCRDVIVMHLKIERSQLESDSKHPDRPPQRTCVRDQITKFLGYSAATIHRIHNEWIEKGKITPTKKPANRKHSEKVRIEPTVALRKLVSDHVRER